MSEVDDFLICFANTVLTNASSFIVFVIQNVQRQFQPFMIVGLVGAKFLHALTILTDLPMEIIGNEKETSSVLGRTVFRIEMLSYGFRFFLSFRIKKST